MNLITRFRKWVARRAMSRLHTGEPIEIGRAMIENNPDSTNFGRKIRRAANRGTMNRRIIVDVVCDGYRHTYHATKGWRCVKES